MDFDFDKMIMIGMDSVTGINRSTGEIKFMYDEIKEGSIENGGEISYATGANQKRLAYLQRAKTTTISFKNGYVVVSGLAAKIGADVINASEDEPFTVPTVEYLTVKEDDGTGDFTAQAEEGKIPVVSSVKYVYIANKDMTQGTKLTIDEDFTLDDEGLFTFTTDLVEDGTVVICCYDYTVTEGKKISDDADKFSENVKLIVDIRCADICDQSIIYHCRLVMYNTVPDMNDTWEFGDDPVVEDFTAEAMVDPCSPNSVYWDMYVVE